MPESIRNVGGFKGGETIVHVQGCATAQATLRSASSSPSDTLRGQPVAFKSGKVVTRVVTDLNSGWELKQTRLLRKDFIGEQNRCSTITKIFKCEVILIEVNRQLLKGALLPPIACDFLEGDGSEIFSRFLPI